MDFKPEKSVADKATEILKNGKVEEFLKNTKSSVSGDGKFKLGDVPIIGDKLELIIDRFDDLIDYFRSSDVPMSKKTIILAMVIYMFIPNLPVPFYIDELIVGGFLIKKIRKELDAFKRGEYSGNPNVIDMKAIPAKNEEKRNPFVDLNIVFDEKEEKEEKGNPFVDLNIVFDKEEVK